MLVISLSARDALRLAFLEPQLTWGFRLLLATTPFCPVIRIAALPGDLQRSALFCSSPFLPPSRLRTNWVTGTSGTVSKLVRSPPPLGESMRPSSSMST